MGPQVGSCHEGLLQGSDGVPLEVGLTFKYTQEGPGRQTLKWEGEASVLEMPGELETQPRTGCPPPPPHLPGLSLALFIQLIQLHASHYVAQCSHSCEQGSEPGPSPCLLANNSAPSPGPCSLQCCSGRPLCLPLSDWPYGKTDPQPATLSPSSIALQLQPLL